MGRTVVFCNSKDCSGGSGDPGSCLASYILLIFLTPSLPSHLFRLIDVCPLPLYAQLHQKQKLKSIDRCTITTTITINPGTFTTINHLFFYHLRLFPDHLSRFTSSPTGLLIATDVAARGLDIPDIQHVVHYQVAAQMVYHCIRRNILFQIGSFVVFLA